MKTITYCMAILFPPGTTSIDKAVIADKRPSSGYPTFTPLMKLKLTNMAIVYPIFILSFYITSGISIMSRTVTPKTNAELEKALCSSYDRSGVCSDNEPKIILLTKVFDFRGTEGKRTEQGCYHLSNPAWCLIRGQKKLNINNQCKGLKSVAVTYDLAGTKPLLVGSNKNIVSRGGGLRGKGLKVYKNKNVNIVGLSITDINPDVIWGGDAITLDFAQNVLIHRNYISRIGRQMIVSGFNACQGIIISNNEFDGRTPYSAYCDGSHYWLWLFLGADDKITLYNNYVHHTSGRGPHITGLRNSKVLLHMIKNRFENINHSGLVEAYEPTARILIEGNTFINVSNIVSKNNGQIYFPFNKVYGAVCKSFIGRSCFLNTVIKSVLNIKTNVNILKELKNTIFINTDEIDMLDINYQKFKYNKANNLLNILSKYKTYNW